MAQPTVLICGAGIAGPTLAFWLARNGFAPTVVERSVGLRTSGNPVDVHGDATGIARRMGILPRLQAAATQAPGLTFVTQSGHRIGPLRLGRPRGDDVEVPRADLAAILCEAAADGTEFLFGDSITALHQDDGGVDVTFEHSAPRRFHLVVGADGLHSTVRGLAFGPEADYVRPLGLYIATLSLGQPAADPTTVLMYNQPGLSLTIHPVRGTAGAGFIFRGPKHPGAEYRDPEAQRRIVAGAYTRYVWPVPELPDLPDQVRGAQDLYFDAVSRVRLPGWSRGRVALLADAASCVSLFGDGSSLAMVGAATLAEELSAAPGDPALALRRYESRHRRAVNARQRGYRLGAAILVPATRAGLTARNLTARLLPG
ncbi:FAD-dependent monooxygenase [Arthrobacter sp. B1I2]|uniref:FAD-dependent monooxygenase n=1 Tax=Arthrobacter sp. B1I2 TaxID=3042263 RepID=UPI00277D2F69|nr:FAD-dependent monooxygenase [Arthrobacter sp. B1I2]MDQ0731063.1 2-polyprenyl-6-methoxyphenol hydroxylase-like FAD-dependent oxidoreductase [Arthrobacter sp. B1I2]